MTDDELVLLARQGDVNAFDQLVSRHQAAVYRAAFAAVALVATMLWPAAESLAVQSRVAEGPETKLPVERTLSGSPGEPDKARPTGDTNEPVVARRLATNAQTTNAQTPDAGAIAVEALAIPSLESMPVAIEEIEVPVLTLDLIAVEPLEQQ